jgi:hypothetical protein
MCVSGNNSSSGATKGLIFFSYLWWRWFSVSGQARIIFIRPAQSLQHGFERRKICVV